MHQTKLGSLIESIVNVVIGYAFAILSQIIIFPWFGIHIPFTSNLIMGLWFTIISIIRSYLVRRYFNHHLQRATRALYNNS